MTVTYRHTVTLRYADGLQSEHPRPGLAPERFLVHEVAFQDGEHLYATFLDSFETADKAYALIARRDSGDMVQAFGASREVATETALADRAGHRPVECAYNTAHIYADGTFMIDSAPPQPDRHADPIRFEIYRVCQDRNESYLCDRHVGTFDTWEGAEEFVVSCMVQGLPMDLLTESEKAEAFAATKSQLRSLYADAPDPDEHDR